MKSTDVAQRGIAEGQNFAIGNEVRVQYPLAIGVLCSLFLSPKRIVLGQN